MDINEESVIARNLFLQGDSSYQTTSQWAGGRDAWDAAVKWLLERRRVLTKAEKAECDEKKPINAIKMVRERLGCSLMEAKKIVDLYRFPERED